MLFPVSSHTRVAEERLARLLAEHPGPSIHVVKDAKPLRDPIRALVKLLLLSAVGGTWYVAYVFG
jgi:hypothetical protein